MKNENESSKKNNKPTLIASSYGSTGKLKKNSIAVFYLFIYSIFFELFFVFKFIAGVTQGGVTKIRNKTIPIINPIVKSSQWPASTYKKGTYTIYYFFKTKK